MLPHPFGSKIVRLLFGTLTVVVIGLNSIAQPVKYVVLISIDGFRPEFYLDPGWNAPNLRQLMHEGVYADYVRGVFPTVTYPSHTTIITGALPARHGIYYNAPFEPEGTTGKWYWDEKLIRVPTLWDALHQAGLKTAAVGWPVTVGAPIDYNIPEIWLTDKTLDRVAPMRGNSTPKGLFEEVEQHATGKITSNNDLDGEQLTTDDNFARMAAYLIKTYKPSFTAVHFICVDAAAHDEGRDGFGVRKAVASADHAVGKVLEALQLAGIKDSTAVIITGDHGFADINTTLFPNVWLAQNGLITRSGGKMEWKAKFHSGSGSGFLYLKDANDKKTLAEVLKIFDRLPASQRKLFRVVERPELDKLGVDSAVALAISPIEGVSVGLSDTGDAIRAALQRGTHGFFPDYPDMHTGFIVFGAGINKGYVIHQMGLEDIAPVIAKLLSLNFTAPDGVLLPGVLQKK
jgi:predicted AlkP superfamily pyrophosphatase or phosphodiesterase